MSIMPPGSESNTVTLTCLCGHSEDAHVSVLLYCEDCGCTEQRAIEDDECTCGGFTKHLACDVHRDEIR